MSVTQMDKIWNYRFSSRSERQIYKTPYKHPSEFKGNKTIMTIKHLTKKIRSDIVEFIYILKELHDTSRTRRRAGVGIALAGLVGSLLVVATAGLATPVVLGAGAVITGGAAIVGGASLLEYMNTKKNIKDVEKRWEQFVDVFLAEHIYYCDFKDTARMILTHVKHVVYRQEQCYQIFTLLFRKRNPLVPKYYSSNTLYGYLEDATHINKSYSAVTELNTSSFTLFTIFELIKLSFDLDANSESATSQPLRNLVRFLDIVIDILDKLPTRCDCSQYKCPVTYEDKIQMYDTAIRLAEMCNSDDWPVETYREEKLEAEQQKIKEDQAEQQRLNDLKVEIQKMHEAELRKPREVRLQEIHEDDILYLTYEHYCWICKSDHCSVETLREKKLEAEQQKMKEDQAVQQRLIKVQIQKMREAEILKLREVRLQEIYEKDILDLYEDMIAMHEMYEAEIMKMYKTSWLPADKPKHEKHPCSGCNAFNCDCILVCAKCERPL